MGGRGAVERSSPIRTALALVARISCRSESEDQVVRSSCLCDIDNPEAVVFYSPQYEESLLMKYLGESPAGQSVDECSTEFCNYDPLLSDDCMMPSYGNIDPTHSPVSLAASTTSFYEAMPTNDLVISKSEEQPCDRVSRYASAEDEPVKRPSRRGRPMKITSTSKMANYARNYREQKKNQLLAYEAQVKQLSEENQYLRSENKRLTEGFERLSKQVDSLRRMLENSAYPSRDPLQTPFMSPCMHQKNFGDDLFDISDLITFPQ
ncbi:hypothetical protein ANCCEY_15799 [Ancylostoma ceylanicum]|uniref:BZIP domain-containing protein n=1 Tax=Ancylostoma ceylanicum TaxID=53326 RepID=A0A0D6L454_9BILA|nr:hypothetical protein ANCCEY_15799 [Ancylostoma ceylanicum]